MVFIYIFTKNRKPDVIINRKHLFADSEEVFRRQEAMDAARRRLQEQHEAMAEKYLEEQKKVIQLIDIWLFMICDTSVRYKLQLYICVSARKLLTFIENSLWIMYPNWQYEMICLPKSAHEQWNVLISV